MTNRWTMAALFALQSACGVAVSSSTDSASNDGAAPADGAASAADGAAADAAVDAADASDASVNAAVDAQPAGGPGEILVARRAILGATGMLRTATRVFAATIWTGNASHETLSLHSFEADGTAPRALGGMFYRHGTSVPPLARSSIAAQGDAVLVTHARIVSHASISAWGSATGVVRFSADGSAPPPSADFTAGTRTVLDGVTSPELAPSVTARAGGFSVLDMSADRRLRLTLIDGSGAVVGQQLFALPFALSSVSDVRTWAVQARGDAFIVATNDESWRLLEVSERGLTNFTDAIRPISRVQSRPALCAGEGEAFEFAQSAENSATLWALDRLPANALRSAPIEPERPLRGCVEPGLWLRATDVVPRAQVADLWDAERGRARCAAELSLSAEGVVRTINVSGPVAIATDVEGDTSNIESSIVLRAIPLHGCIAAR